MRPGQTSLSSRNYLRRPYSYTDSSHSTSSPDYYSSPYSYAHPGGYYQRYYNRQRYQPDLSPASSSMEMNHAEPGATSSVSSPTETEEPSSDSSSSDDKNKVLTSPYYHYYDPSAYYTHSHSQEETDGTPSPSSPFYLSHRHEGSPSSRPHNGFPSWNGLTGFLLGIIPLSLLVASIVPAFVTVPIASGAASVVAAGRRRRRRSLQGKHQSFLVSERNNYLDQILTILEEILDSPPS